MNAIPKVQPITVRPLQRPSRGALLGSRECALCHVLATHFRWETYYCAKHLQFRQMRLQAKRRRKTVPTLDQLESLLPEDMCCPICRISMHWFARDGRTQVITLQHDRSGEHRLICQSCNSKHAGLPEDRFYTIPDSHSYCGKCEKEKPRIEFYASRRPRAVSSWCKECMTKKVAQYRARRITP